MKLFVSVHTGSAHRNVVVVVRNRKGEQVLWAVFNPGRNLANWTLR